MKDFPGWQAPFGSLFCLAPCIFICLRALIKCGTEKGARRSGSELFCKHIPGAVLLSSISKRGGAVSKKPVVSRRQHFGTDVKRQHQLVDHLNRVCARIDRVRCGKTAQGSAWPLFDFVAMHHFWLVSGRLPCVTEVCCSFTPFTLRFSRPVTFALASCVFRFMIAGSKSCKLRFARCCFARQIGRKCDLLPSS